MTETGSAEPLPPAGKAGTYLDWAATSFPDPEILAEAGALAAACWANPSSAHRAGKEARASLEAARSRFARAAGLRSGATAFTGSGTEADQIPLLAVLRSRLSGLRQSSHIVVSEIEHSAIHAQAQLLERMGIQVSYLMPDSDGRIPPSSVAAALRKDTVMVAVMAVNNETGAVQDIAGIGQALRDASAGQGSPRKLLFHVDAVQAFGKIPFSPESCGVASAAFSAHKIRGPKGSGALWAAKTVEPISVGGGQEGGTRSGTENLYGAWALALAAERAVSRMDDSKARVVALEAAFLAGIAAIPGARPVPEARTPGDPKWSPYIVSASFPGLSGEVLARALSDSGIAVSTGSACFQGHGGKGRRILDAMGLPPEIALSSIRVSFGPLTEISEIDFFLENAASLYRKLKT